MQDYTLLVNLSLMFAIGLGLGLFTHRLGLSPIVGYLLTGIALGPSTPGFVADAHMATEFAEIGVILLMFGVGLHFHLGDLIKVRSVALPGAFAQVVVATFLGVLVSLMFGRTITVGVVLGLAVSVASTVVLIRVLMDNNVLETGHGHLAVGWLLVEDLFTVLALVILPGMAAVLSGRGDAAGADPWLSLAGAMGRIVLLVTAVMVLGKRAVPWLLRQVARSRSRELFTLTVLALALAIATGSAVGFGVSMALGAFLAGMVVGQSEVSHQAAADALPMRDAFAVLFFVSVGLLFDPKVILENPGFLIGLLIVIMIAKPLTAFIICWLFGRSVRTGLTVGLALAQIGEFSFILGSAAVQLGMVSAASQSLLVTCAVITIALNPPLFRLIGPVENWIRRRPKLWRLLNRRSELRGEELNASTRARLMTQGDVPRTSALVVGYGPVGQTVAEILRRFHIQPVIIDMNLNTVESLSAAGVMAIYGDAARREVLESAGIARASYLIVTPPEPAIRTSIIMAARSVHAGLKIIVRTRYLSERQWQESLGVVGFACEEVEVAIGLAAELLEDFGVGDSRLQSEVREMRHALEAGLLADAHRNGDHAPQT